VTRSRDALLQACRQAGLDADGAEVIRAAENTLFRLRGGGVVARVTRPGRDGTATTTATKEVRVSRWLRAQGIPVAEALIGIPQPIAVHGRAVTLWRELPEHRESTTVELATMLRRLHGLPAPPFALPPLAPFVRLRERLVGASLLDDADREWLLAHLAELEVAYAELSPGRPWCAVHGDAWSGNLVVTAEHPVLLDLERFAHGPPEWDLTSLAVGYTTFGSIAAAEWDDFCHRYGDDVTTWAGFTVLRDARELRKVTFALQLAPTRADIADQARYRVACIRGVAGPRPWRWQGVP
jgi:aminoglycoside phosphotransferase (APT) family kinase protein